MKNKIILPVLLAFIFCLGIGGSASAITFTWNNGANLSAEADFTVSGTNLVVTLTNTGGDVLVPTDVLTAVFFNLSGDPTLTPVSALLNSGSTVLFGSEGGGNVGGEWAYKGSLIGAPLGATQGISSTGLDLFGDANFNGVNLQDPAALDGLQYGITSGSDDPTTGNNKVTGSQALIKNSVIFTLSGLPLGYVPTVSKVWFLYGTDLDEGGGEGKPPQVPEPMSLLLLGLGLVGVAGFSRKFKA